jgi:hypothetical protein
MITKSCLCRFLPQEFPDAPPIITVSPNLKHPLLNGAFQIIFDQNNTWSNTSSLGKTVKELQTTFFNRPPTLFNSGPNASASNPPALPGRPQPGKRSKWDFPQLETMR